jgi:hypothetical protein
MIDLEEMFARAVPLKCCNYVKAIQVSNREVPLWLRTLDEWDKALPVLNMVKRSAGIGIIAGVGEFSIAYLFEIHQVAGKLRAHGVVMLPAPSHEECAAGELRVLMHQARESAAAAGLNFLSMEQQP